MEDKWDSKEGQTHNVEETSLKKGNMKLKIIMRWLDSLKSLSIHGNNYVTCRNVIIDRIKKKLTEKEGRVP